MMKLAEKYEVEEISSLCVNFIRQEIVTYSIYEIHGANLLQQKIFQTCYSYKKLIQFVEYFIPKLMSPEMTKTLDIYIHTFPAPVLAAMLQYQQTGCANVVKPRHLFTTLTCLAKCASCTAVPGIKLVKNCKLCKIKVCEDCMPDSDCKHECEKVVGGFCKYLCRFGQFNRQKLRDNLMDLASN